MIFLFILSIVIVSSLWLLIRYLLARRRRKNAVAFFHLYCSSGGGGERVLWHTIEAILKKYPTYSIYIYSHKDVQEDTLRILLKVRELFKIDLISNKHIIDKLEFIPIRCSSLVDARNYPFLTLLFQNLMSIILAIEAAYRLTPEIYMETIGFTFTLPVFKLHQSTVITYVHYPTISNDMIQNVRTSTHSSFNNRAIFTRSPVLRRMKLLYYKLLAHLYGFVGRQADLVMVNSTWTQNHIDSMWHLKSQVVYPPCDVESFKSIRPTRTTTNSSSTLNVISIAQFRPEKNHQLQIEAFDYFLSKTEAFESKLTLYGGCRDNDDRQRVDELKDYIHRLDLAKNIDIVVGAPFEQLLDGIKNADVAIHTMKNEHFGIVLLECMAAGLITIAHNSGGPRTDIIDDTKSGFLADNLEDFGEVLVSVSKMSAAQRIAISECSTKKADQFSTQVFEDSFIRLVDKFFSKGKK